MATRIGARGYLECSAKSGEGVPRLSQKATEAALLTTRRSRRSRSPVLRRYGRLAADMRVFHDRCTEHGLDNAGYVADTPVQCSERQ